MTTKDLRRITLIVPLITRECKGVEAATYGVLSGADRDVS